MNLSLPALNRFIVGVLHRFHLIIFAVVVLGGLVISVLLLNDIVNQSSESGDYVAPSANTTFDQKTIDQIEQLKTPGQSGDSLNLSQGRTNPFVE